MSQNGELDRRWGPSGSATPLRVAEGKTGENANGAVRVKVGEETGVVSSTGAQVEEATEESGDSVHDGSEVATTLLLSCEFFTFDELMMSAGLATALEVSEEPRKSPLGAGIGLRRHLRHLQVP